jgi:hypothetical protein
MYLVVLTLYLYNIYMVAQPDIYPQYYFTHFGPQLRIICKDWETFQILKLHNT